MELNLSSVAQLLVQFQAVFWDFDGVLLDSMPVREIAFRTSLSNYPNEQVERLIVYHRGNGGLSRYVKFRYFQTEILGVPVDEKLIMGWSDVFSSYCSRNLAKTSLLIAPTNEVVRLLANRVPQYIVSGSDGKELRMLCDKLGLTDYFVSIHGSPTPKPELIRTVIEQYQYKADATVLIGDSQNDLDAANAYKVGFIAFNNYDLQNCVDHYWDLKSNTIRFSE